MDLRDLRYFETIAELEHIGRATERLHRTQPALTSCVRRLEQACGALMDHAERLMRQPGNQLMQYNLEGTRQRMGDAFGRSVVPQRPAR